MDFSLGSLNHVKCGLNVLNCHGNVSLEISSESLVFLQSFSQYSKIEVDPLKIEITFSKSAGVLYVAYTECVGTLWHIGFLTIIGRG